MKQGLGCPAKKLEFHSEDTGKQRKVSAESGGIWGCSFRRGLK